MIRVEKTDERGEWMRCEIKGNAEERFIEGACVVSRLAKMQAHEARKAGQTVTNERLHDYIETLAEAAYRLMLRDDGDKGAPLQ